MVTHVVLFKIAEVAHRERARDLLLGLEGRIPGLLEVEVGLNAGNDARAQDLCLITRHESWEALAAYQPHAAHQEVVSYIKSVAQGAVVVDYET